MHAYIYIYIYIYTSLDLVHKMHGGEHDLDRLWNWSAMFECLNYKTHQWFWSQNRSRLWSLNWYENWKFANLHCRKFTNSQLCKFHNFANSWISQRRKVESGLWKAGSWLKKAGSTRTLQEVVSRKVRFGLWKAESWIYAQEGWIHTDAARGCEPEA